MTISRLFAQLFTSLPFIALPCSSALADTNQIYLEQNGYIHLEAEDAEAIGDWKLRTEISGYTGPGYLEWTGSDYFSKDDAGNGKISYHFRIETAGNYEFRWRSRIAKGDSNTESNDSWVRFDTGSNVSGEEPLYGWTKVYMGEADTWSWSARTVDHQARSVRQYFTQGNHTVDISGRSNGHAIDQIALYRYPDVNFDAGLNGILPLSLFIQEDGTVVDPNPETDGETTTPPEPQQENVLSAKANVELIAANADKTNTAYCEADMLTLPAIKSATLSLLDQADAYISNELTLAPDTQSVLLTYDLSLLPPLNSARLLYSTGSAISNGSLQVYLGSRNDWPANDVAELPDALVKIADAQGGWDVESRYASTLDESLLPRDVTTFILALETGSDRLEIGNTAKGIPLPDLVLTGEGDFCADWAANVAEDSQQIPAVIESGIGVTAPKKSAAGGVAHWFGLILLLGLLRNLLTRRGGL